MDLHIKFELNKELDKQMAFYFLNSSNKVGGIDFSKNVTGQHPELELARDLNEDKKKQTIDEYFDKYYEENAKDLRGFLEETKKEWEKVEKDFILQINNIFKNPTLPKGKYIGYLSIINCNPRFLDTKTFQIFYKHKLGSNNVIVHEVLHFFFYDYAVKNFPDIFKELNMNSGVFWILAEVFNDTIQNTPAFIEMQKGTGVTGYPEHQQYQDKAKKLWSDSQDIDDWITKMYDYLNKVV